jgi:hypothetical protein
MLERERNFDFPNRNRIRYDDKIFGGWVGNGRSHLNDRLYAMARIRTIRGSMMVGFPGIGSMMTVWRSAFTAMVGNDANISPIDRTEGSGMYEGHLGKEPERKNEERGTNGFIS